MNSTESPYGVYQRDTRTPRHPLPVGTCDAQAHVYGDPERYPMRRESPYAPPPATIEDLDRMHAALGVRRALLVQPASYGADHSLLVDVLSAAPDRYRGCCVLDLDWTDAELDRLHRAGVRGARFVFARFLRQRWTAADLARGAAMARGLGWFLKVFATPDQLVELAPVLRELDVPCVLDHLGYLDPADGLDQPARALIDDLLRRGNWWLMLSCGDRLSHRAPPWPDVVPFIHHFASTAPDRVVWGSDWPHPIYRGAVPNDADMVDLVSGAIDDPTVRRKLFVDNPAELFGFPSEERRDGGDPA